MVWRPLLVAVIIVRYVSVKGVEWAVLTILTSQERVPAEVEYSMS